MFRKCWERITDRIVDDLFTLEERELILARARLIAAEAERVELRTQLQRKRIAEREAREAARKQRADAEKKFAEETFRPVATLRFPIELGGVSYYQEVELSENESGNVRKLEWPKHLLSGGEEYGYRPYPSDSAREGIIQTCKSSRMYIKYIQAWHNFYIDHAALAKCKLVVMALPEKWL